MIRLTPHFKVEHAMTYERMQKLMDRIGQLAYDQFQAGISAGHPMAGRSEQDLAGEARREELEVIADELSQLVAYAREQ